MIWATHETLCCSTKCAVCTWQAPISISVVFTVQFTFAGSDIRHVHRRTLRVIIIFIILFFHHWILCLFISYTRRWCRCFCRLPFTFVWLLFSSRQWILPAFAGSRCCGALLVVVVSHSIHSFYFLAVFFFFSFRFTCVRTRRSLCDAKPKQIFAFIYCKNSTTEDRRYVYIVRWILFRCGRSKFRL